MKSDKLRKEIYKFDLSHNRYRKFMQFSICMLFFTIITKKKMVHSTGGRIACNKKIVRATIIKRLQSSWSDFATVVWTIHWAIKFIEPRRKRRTFLGFIFSVVHKMYDEIGIRVHSCKICNRNRRSVHWNLARVNLANSKSLRSLVDAPCGRVSSTWTERKGTRSCQHKIRELDTSEVSMYNELSERCKSE